MPPSPDPWPYPDVHDLGDLPEVDENPDEDADLDREVGLVVQDVEQDHSDWKMPKKTECTDRPSRDCRLFQNWISVQGRRLEAEELPHALLHDPHAPLAAGGLSLRDVHPVLPRARTGRLFAGPRQGSPHCAAEVWSGACKASIARSVLCHAETASSGSSTPHEAGGHPQVPVRPGFCSLTWGPFGAPPECPRGSPQPYP